MATTEIPQEYRPNGSVSSAELKQYIERIENLEEEKKGISEGIKEVFSELKMQGYDAKVVRQVLKIRKQNAQERQEMEAILQLYLDALGIA